MPSDILDNLHSVLFYKVAASKRPLKLHRNKFASLNIKMLNSFDNHLINTSHYRVTLPIKSVYD